VLALISVAVSIPVTYSSRYQNSARLRERVTSGGRSRGESGVTGNRGPGVLRIDESRADFIAHRRRDVTAGVKNSPDIHDLIADDVKHQIRESNQRRTRRPGISSS
jgi:hypothetical protein